MARHPALFDYPARATLGRVVPKTRIYAAGKPGRRVRDKIAQQVARIVWQYKLAPETLNLSASRAVPEIQVFSIYLKPGASGESNPPITQISADGKWLKKNLRKSAQSADNSIADLPVDILRCIDRAIGFPLIFELTTNREDGAARDQIRVAATYKRPSEAEAGKWVIGEYFATDWLPADTPRAPLPVALDLARLYEQMLRQLISLPAHEGESIAALAERHRQVAIKQRECRRLEARLFRERQFNRKVEINRQLRELKTELDELAQLSESN